MAINHYFSNFSPAVINEQRVLEDLIGESVQIYGHACQYLPRESYDAVDLLFGEDPVSKFTRAYTMEMFIANVEGFEGDGDFFSKFGMEIRETSNFVLPRRAFEKYTPASVRTRPREGDLVYVPVMRKIFEIKFVEEELLFFSLGKRNPYMYELRCEVFRYSQEDFGTGIHDVDEIEKQGAYTIQLTLESGSGNYVIDESVYQGASFATSSVSAKVKDWDITTGLIEVINIKGSFTNATTLIGVTSNTRYTLTSSDGQTDFADSDLYDNKLLQTEADVFIQTTETNPLGVSYNDT